MGTLSFSNKCAFSMVLDAKECTRIRKTILGARSREISREDVLRKLNKLLPSLVGTVLLYGKLGEGPNQGKTLYDLHKEKDAGAIWIPVVFRTPPTVEQAIIVPASTDDFDWTQDYTLTISLRSLHSSNGSDISSSLVLEMADMTFTSNINFRMDDLVGFFDRTLRNAFMQQAFLKEGFYPIPLTLQETIAAPPHLQKLGQEILELRHRIHMLETNALNSTLEKEMGHSQGKTQDFKLIKDRLDSGSSAQGNI